MTTKEEYLQQAMDGKISWSEFEEITGSAHATTPRNPREAIGLAMFKEDSVSPILKAFGGNDLLWLLDKWHPGNISGLFKRHDLIYDLAYAGILVAPSSRRWDQEVRDGLKHLAKIDLSTLPYPVPDPSFEWPDSDPLTYARNEFPPDTLERHAKIFYRVMRAYGIIFWPGKDLT